MQWYPEVFSDQAILRSEPISIAAFGVDNCDLLN
jgi:hypothetical protein